MNDSSSRIYSFVTLRHIPMVKKNLKYILLILLIPVVGGFFAVQNMQVSGSFDEPRKWVEEKWGSATSPPLFQKSQVSIPQSDISVTRTGTGTEKSELQIDTAFSGDPADFHEYERWVHAVRWGRRESASAELARGRVRVTQIGLLSHAFGEGPEKRGYKMPGWNLVEEAEWADLSRDRSPWKTIVKLRLQFDDADVLAVRRLRLMHLPSGWNVGKSYSLSGLTRRRQSIDSKLTIATAAPVEVALVADVIYDCHRDIDVPMSDTEVRRVEGFEIQRLALITGVRFPMPLLTGSTHPYHQLRYERSGPRQTRQSFSGRPDEGCSIFINTRPFVRQDLIGLYFEDSEGKIFPHPTLSVYAGGAPTTAPFWPFVNRVTPVSVKMDIARYIDRVIIPLGPLPFRELSPEVDDFFDVPIPRVDIKDGYELFRAIEESTGVRTDYRQGESLDRNLVEAFEGDEMTPREFLNKASQVYGAPAYHRTESILTFGDRMSVFQRFLDWWRSIF